MMPKPIQRMVGIASCMMSTAQSICIVGARYCSIPIVFKGTVRAALLNSNSGIAVTRPEEMRSRACFGPWAKKLSRPSAAR